MKFLQKTPTSSMIDEYEYDYDKLELEVKFKAGETYCYLGVDEGTFDRLQLAESKGRFIATEIKKFAFEKVTGADINKPNPWSFPTAKDFEDKVMASDATAAWPFPTGKKPV